LQGKVTSVSKAKYGKSRLTQVEMSGYWVALELIVRK